MATPPTGFDTLRTLAVSRLFLDNFDHVTAYWVGMGLKLAQVALKLGADDLHGTIVEEHIFHMAGATSPQLQTEAAMVKAIRVPGRVATVTTRHILPTQPSRGDPGRTPECVAARAGMVNFGRGSSPGGAVTARRPGTDRHNVNRSVSQSAADGPFGRPGDTNRRRIWGTMLQAPSVAGSTMTAGPIPNPPEPGHDYTLRSDLAKLCLPQTFRDANKKLAWVNSICLLFLLIGLMGLKPPRIIVKPLTQPTEIVPVVFTPPEVPPEIQTQPKAEDTEPSPRDQPADPPQIATVVAASSAAVAFAVPVEGPVMVAREARFASPPRARQSPGPPPKPANFNPQAATGGHYPIPSYPRAERLARHEGKILLSVVVDASGAPRSVTVKDSCGWPALDRYAADWVRRNWQWVPGDVRYYHVPVIFRIP